MSQGCSGGSIPEPIVEQPLPVHFQDSVLQEIFNERASIFEFDGGLPRPEAEARALAYVRESLGRIDEKELLRPQG